MTSKEAQIIIGNIPIKPEALDDCYSIAEYQEAKAMAIEALGQLRDCKACKRNKAHIYDGRNMLLLSVCNLLS